ncbi:excinuclease ABC subunit UvrA [Aerococcus sp. UMB8608]|uniref:excinuclease ABC subunit UvrA n=1 Tax=unclassified Aerococcus TaxID=2618060 RepID=UPI0008A3AAF4|nr:MULTISPECIES: excinuclease ABC subunit UvrA [unclassified Aerococcus]MDK6369030.1 excinuclease ABC subunit UvrA [Aerococcus sp. UMB9870]MDK6678932.1 excinuclease ABC subunit UvrA [Aerococcus sp. UMB8608]MDK6686523.1 excinuclease ABC subunit UvrA [Aerococcus sp. UMB8623]MDK6939591.1 excinuclease ABC subunit UvrA [Aerococcus sp. UMB8487]OFK17914.1 ABC-ATPase UvrA [Aerococcus sp. HMSC072A12]
MRDEIVVRGARSHNLKNIDVEIPRNEMVVVTGLSGSGKSSLAFDTLYAEGQRRYIESLSAFARQFLGNSRKADVDSIDGLSPAISIDQKTTNRNPRSTVGTITEVNDYLRLLYARVGQPICPNDGTPIASQSIDQMIERAEALEERTRVQVMAPVVYGKKGQHKRLLEKIQQQGYVRVQIDGELYDIDDLPELNKNQKHNINIVVDRLVIKEGIRTRLADSLENALRLTDGYALLDIIDGEEILFSEHYACPLCGFTVGELEPRLFSFNAPYGRCEVCDGLGQKLVVDLDLLIPDPDKSLEEGALQAWNSNWSGYYPTLLKQAAQAFDIPTDKPFKDLSEDQQNLLLYGSGDETFHFHYVNDFGKVQDKDMAFEGVAHNVSRRYHNSTSNMVRDNMRQYLAELPCDKCHGKRLNERALCVKVEGEDIADVTAMPIEKTIQFFSQLHLGEQDSEIAAPILEELRSRLGFLQEVGLDYLTLDRSAGTLSGGEAQRIRLATQIGSNLSGIMYVLDEPSIGLHQRDNDRLIRSLQRMRDLGNTLIVVEHDEETMLAADYLIDMGPGAGEHGGEVVASGSPEEVAQNPASLTGRYLSGDLTIELPKERRQEDKGWLEIKGAKQNNLKGIDVRLPIGRLDVVTGVSGSGKSSLINEVLKKTLARDLNRAQIHPGKADSVSGYEGLDKIIDIDQSPIGRTPRSNPATYTSVFDDIRELFAQTNEAKIRGYSKGRFSFNVKGGRCEACKGDGILKVEMHFLPDVYVPCELCKGTRYNAETLEVTYKGKNIAEVLDMRAEEALDFFSAVPKIKRKLQTMVDVGLGYVSLGQPAPSLSGGEAQRMKLASELQRVATGKTVYILDEPTTGLHSHDIKRLLEVLQRLVDAGNTVIIIEHNLDVIKTADYIVDLGPEGGEKGGQLVACGTPEEVAQVEASYTGQYLKKLLEKE